MSADLKISIGADSTALGQGLNDAAGKVDAFVAKIGKIADVGDALTSIGGKLSAGLTLPIVGLGVAAVKSYGEIESLQKGLEAVLGSADAAEKEFEKLKEVAKLPGLGMKEAVQGSINLQAIGLSADKSRDILQQFGNAVATVGKGRAEFERAIYGVQQLANTDFPLGEDLNIIKDALPQVSNLLKDAFGSSRSDELAKMGVSSQQVLDTILTGLGKLPRVTGGIKGAFENLGDSMQTSLARVGKIIDKNLNLSGLVDKITGFIDKIVSGFENLDPMWQTVILGAAGFAAALGPVLVGVGGFLTLLPTMLSGLGALSVAFTAMTGPIGLVVVGIGAIVAAVVSNWDKITPYIQGTIDWFKRLYNESALVRGIVQGIGFAFNALGMIAVEVVKTIWANFKTLGKGLLETFAGVGGVIEGALTLDWDKVKAGYKRGMNGIVNSLVGVAANSANSFSAVWSNLDKLQNKWSNLSLDNVKVNAPKLADETTKTVEEEVKKGIGKVGKANTVKVDLPDVDAISGGSKGYYLLGKIFGTPAEIEAYSQSLVDTTSAGFANLNTVMTDAQKTLLEKQIFFTDLKTKFNEALSGLISETIVSGIADSFSAMGEAMASGSNIMQAFGKSVLTAFGGFLKNLGKMMIQYGVTALAYSIASKALTNPITAAPAAIALIAAGAALSMIGGAISSAAQGGSSGSYSSANGSSYNSGGTSYSSNYTSGGSTGGVVEFVIRGADLYGVLKQQENRNNRLNAG